MQELLLLPMSFPPAAITARLRQFSGLQEGEGKVDVDLAMSMAEYVVVPRVVMLKFLGKYEFFQYLTWEDPTRRIFT